MSSSAAVLTTPFPSQDVHRCGAPEQKVDAVVAESTAPDDGEVRRRVRQGRLLDQAPHAPEPFFNWLAVDDSVIGYFLRRHFFQREHHDGAEQQQDPGPGALGHGGVSYQLIAESADVGFVTPHDATQAADIAVELRRLVLGWRFCV